MHIPILGIVTLIAAGLFILYLIWRVILLIAEPVQSALNRHWKRNGFFIKQRRRAPELFCINKDYLRVATVRFFFYSLRMRSLESPSSLRYQEATNTFEMLVPKHLPENTILTWIMKLLSGTREFLGQPDIATVTALDVERVILREGDKK